MGLSSVTAFQHRVLWRPGWASPLLAYYTITPTVSTSATRCAVVESTPPASVHEWPRLPLSRLLYSNIRTDILGHVVCFVVVPVADAYTPSSHPSPLCAPVQTVPRPCAAFTSALPGVGAGNGNGVGTAGITTTTSFALTSRKWSRLFLLLANLSPFLLDSLSDGLLPTRRSDSIVPSLVQQILLLSCSGSSATSA